MKRKVVHKRRTIHRKTKPKRFHHKVISFFKGDGGIYVIFILATLMAGSFALTGGILPNLNPNPPASSEVTIDPDSANQSSERALQLVDIKIKPTNTPTPTPSAPSLTPSPTTIQACLDKMVITMMIDLSLSMFNDNKIIALNTALDDFVGSLAPKTVVGGIAFGAPSSDFALDGIKGVKELSVYTSNKTNVAARFTDLEVGPGGGTYMRNGFQAAINRLKAYKSSREIGNLRFVSILFSDGVPEIMDDLGPSCLGGGKVDGVCWARQQDPRSTPYGLTSTNYITQMDGLVDKAYSVAIYDSEARGSGLTDDLITLLKTNATSGNKPYYQAIDLKDDRLLNKGQLTNFFRSIINDSCS